MKYYREKLKKKKKTEKTGKKKPWKKRNMHVTGLAITMKEALLMNLAWLLSGPFVW